MSKDVPDRLIYKTYFNLSKIYGPVVGLPYGSIFGLTKPYITVCGYDAVHEALLNPDLDGRIELETSQVNFVFLGKKGAFNNSNILLSFSSLIIYFTR